MPGVASPALRNLIVDYDPQAIHGAHYFGN
jgi:hypothetical protein